MAEVRSPVADAGLGGQTRAFVVSNEILKVLILLADVVAIVAGAVTADEIYHRFFLDGIGDPATSAQLGLLVAILFLHTSWRQNSYNPSASIRPFRRIHRAFVAWVISFSFIIWLGFLLKVSDQFSRGSSILFFVIGFAFLVAVRLVAGDFVRRALASGHLVLRRAFVVSLEAWRDGATLSREFCRSGVKIVGNSSIEPAALTAGGAGETAARLVSDLREAFSRNSFDEVYLVFPWRDWEALAEISRALRALPVSVYIVADENVAGLIEAPRIHLNGGPAVSIQRAPLSPVNLLAKRLLDILVAGGVLLLLSPILVLTALAIWFESGRPIIFKQDRKGFGGRTFKIYKFRTMYCCENGDNIQQARADDPRVTPLGYFLRRSSVDELPQLYNVLKGDMSIVGPRPHAIAHDTHYLELIAHYAHRHNVKPGLTGWAQVMGNRGETKELHQMEARVEHDLWYIANWSIWLDIQIILKTGLVLLRAKNAY